MPPQIALIQGLTASETLALGDCQSVARNLSGLQISFDEAMQNPVGDTDPNDVTNPANYRLISAGANLDIETAACASVQGDDVAIAIDAVSYEPVPFRAGLVVNGGQPLASGPYRLLACGSGALLDLEGNPLDGDGNGTGGDDFSATFRIDAENYLVDGNFDCSLEAWLKASTDPNEILHHGDDVDGAMISGSAAVTNLTASSDFSVGQCIPLAAPLSFTFEGRVRLDAGTGISVDAGRYCEYFTSQDCSGESVALVDESTSLGDTAGVWTLLESQGAIGQGSGSLLCSMELHSAGGDAFDARIDDLRLVGDIAPGQRLLQDGFETPALPAPIGDGGGSGNPNEPDPSLMCDINRPSPAGTMRSNPFQFAPSGGAFQAAETYEDVWGPWPGAANTRFVRIPIFQYVAMPFVTPASGSMQMVWVGSPGLNATSTFVTVTRCPGDFNTALIPRLCRQGSGTEGSSLVATVNGNPNGTCDLEPGTLYFLNIIHGSPQDPATPTCPASACLWVASP